MVKPEKEIRPPQLPPCGPAPRAKRARPWKTFLVCLLVPLVMLGTVYGAREQLLPPAARLLNVGERPTRVDYVMVLGGGLDARPFLAAAMFNAKMTRGILVTESKLSPANDDGITPPDHELTSQVLEYEGVPNDAVILLGPACGSTWDEARRLANFLRSNPNTTVGVVTTSYHTRRTRRVFRRELGQLADQIKFLGVPTERFQEDNWWKSPDGLVTYVNEYCKAAYYWVRY